jgi:hypothetical protein
LFIQDIMNIKTYYDRLQSCIFSEDGEGVKKLLSTDAPDAKDITLKIFQINVSERIHIRTNF